MRSPVTPDSRAKTISLWGNQALAAQPAPTINTARRIVMKKAFLCLLALAAVLGLAGCKRATPTPPS